MQYWDYAFSLLFTLIPLCNFKGTSVLTIYQTPSVTVIERDTAIMNCTVSEESLGPVRWYKGSNQQQQLLYSQFEMNISDGRVSKTVKEGPTRNTDYSITFKIIRLEDAGVYYCVKFKFDKVTVLANGSGTHLYVNKKYGTRTCQTPPCITVSEGGTAIMECVLSDESLGPVRWYKGGNQQPQLLYSQSKDEKPDPRVNKTVKESLRRDTDHSITFSRIRLEDAGVYYCVKFKSDKVTVATNGSETHLYVNTSPSPPSISGPTERLVLHTNVTLSCRAERFYPPEVNVTWWENEIELLGSTSEVSSYNGIMAYQVQSNITVVARINTSVTCKINHPLLDKPINSTFKINNIVKEPSLPSVFGPKDRVDINNSVVISCISNGFYPNEINLTWWKNEVELNGSEPVIQPYGADKTYQVQSNITVQAETDSYVTCKINHTALDQPINSTFKIKINNFVKEPSPPLVSGPKDRVDINSSVVISCVSTGFYPKEINLTWWKNDEELCGFKADIQPYGADKTYQVQSSITVRAEIDSYVTCKINHTSLDQPINSTFKINDIVKRKPSHPTISGPTKEIQQNTNVTLSCTSAGFYPADINVTWWENEMELHGTKPEVQFDSENKTYQVQSNITVLAKEESSITCRISHTALEQPINSTFNINITKASNPARPSTAIIVVIICGAVAVCALLVIFLCQKRRKGTAATQNGSVTSNVETEQERHITSNVDEEWEKDKKDDRITYATLQPHQVGSRLKNVVQENSTEYAAVCLKSVPDNDITYVTVNTAK